MRPSERAVCVGTGPEKHLSIPMSRSERDNLSLSLSSDSGVDVVSLIRGAYQRSIEDDAVCALAGSDVGLSMPVSTSPMRDVLTLGTDFSGLDTPSVALRRMGVPVHHRFAPDIASHFRRFIRDKFAPDEVFTTTGSAAKCKLRTDLYVAGPPCVRFSVLGGRRGELDRD